MESGNATLHCEVAAGVDIAAADGAEGCVSTANDEPGDLPQVEDEVEVKALKAPFVIPDYFFGVTAVAKEFPRGLTNPGFLLGAPVVREVAQVE